MASRPRSFLGGSLPPAANLATARARGGLGHLAAGVGVDFGVEHQDVDVAAGGQHVVQAAVADVVGPAVAAHDPHAALDQHVGQAEQVLGARRRASAFRRRPEPAPARLSRPDALALLGDAGFVGLVGVEQGLRQVVAERAGQRGRAARGRIRSACPASGGNPGRTRRCLRTASWTRPARALRGSWPRAWWAGCRRRWTSSRWRWRSARGRRRAATAA